MSSAPAVVDDDDLPEISLEAYEELDRWRDLLDRTPAIDRRTTFAAAAAELYRVALREPDPRAQRSIENSLRVLGREHARLAADDVDYILIGVKFADIERANRADDCSGADEPPGPTSPDDYGNTEIALPKPPTPAVLITPAQWPAEDPPSVDWLVRDRIERGTVNLFAGDGGTGKTDALMQLAVALPRGAQDWLGMELCAQGPVVIISAEEPEDKIRLRLFWLGKRDGYCLPDLGNLHLWFPDERTSDCVLATADRHTGIMQPTLLFLTIKAAIERIQPVLVGVDSIAATFVGNQNDRVSARGYVTLWRPIARIESRPAVVLLDHPSLSGLTNNTGRGGSMDWWNAVRGVLHLRKPEDKAEAERGVRILETGKANYAKCGPETALRLQWANGGLALERSLSSPARAAIDNACEDTFLRLLDEREGQGRHVSSEPRAATYAAKAFADMPNNGGFTRNAFAGAMERLLQAGKIIQVMEGPASRQRGRLVRMRA